MFKYAQIDLVTNKCVSVSFLSDEVEAEHMILLADEDDVNTMDTFDNGIWVKYIPPEPEPLGLSLEEKYARLEQQLAQTNADFSSFMDYYFTNTM